MDFISILFITAILLLVAFSALSLVPKDPKLPPGPKGLLFVFSTFQFVVQYVVIT